MGDKQHHARTSVYGRVSQSVLPGSHGYMQAAMSRIKLLFISFPFTPLIALSQALDIRGVVSDSATGDRIPYANVVFLGTTKGAATNAEGFFLIPRVEFGSYEVVASILGYRKQSKRVEVRGDRPITVNFSLSAEAIELKGVEAEAKVELKEIQTSVHVLGKVELHRVPVAAQADIFRDIQILPGIVSTSDVNSQFYVRGGASDQNLILLDGMRIYNPYHAYGLFSTIDADVIRMAEVYTGAFPADFGGRLSSVTNIFTRDGNSTRHSAQYNINFLSSKLEIEGPVSDAIQALFTARKSLFSTTFSKFLHESAPLSFYDGLLKVSFKRPHSQDKLSLQVIATGDHLPSNKVSEPSYSWFSRAVGFKANILTADRLYTEVNVSYSVFDQERNIEPDQVVVPMSNRVEDFSVRGNGTLYTDSKDLYFFGFEFTFPKCDYIAQNRAGLPVRISNSFADGSAWIRYQMILGALRADVGVRGEIGALFRARPLRSAFQPRVNFSADLLEGWKAKAAYGRFSQEVISITNEDDVLPILIPFVLAPKGLDPEWADHVVIGIDGNFAPNLSANLQGYYKYYGSLVTYNPDKYDTRDPDYVNSRAESYGAEALLRLSDPIIDVYVAYTLGWVRINANGFIYVPRYDRRHTLHLLGAIHPAKNLDVTARWEFGSGLPFTQTIGFYDRLTMGYGYPNPFLTETGKPATVFGPKNAARLPAYHRLDFSLSYRFEVVPWLRSYLGINVVNVYDRKNIFYFERKTGQRVNMLGFFPSASLTIEFLP